MAAWMTGEMRTGVLCPNMRDRDHFEDLGVDGRIITLWPWNWTFK